MLNMLSKVDKDEEIDKDEKNTHTLQSHTSIYEKYSGKVERLKEGFAEVHLEIVEDMLADKIGLIHNGYIFSSASFAAAISVNEKYGFVIGSMVHFLTPVREHDIVVFKAKSRHKIGRKRVVDVVGRVHEIRVFIGEFTVTVMDRHVLNVKLDEIEIPEKDDEAL